MKLQITSIFIAILSMSFAHQFNLRNNCPFTVWPGILGNPGKSIPLNGGFQLNLWETRTFWVENGWAGRIWPRRNCYGSGWCESGDCGNYERI